MTTRCDCGSEKRASDQTCGECLRARVIAEFTGGIGNFETLDPNRFCTRHGLPLPTGLYGHRYGGCTECEP